MDNIINIKLNLIKIKIKNLAGNRTGLHIIVTHLHNVHHASYVGDKNVYVNQQTCKYIHRTRN